MNEPRAQEPAGAISAADIGYALFRHKWAVVLCSMAGLAAAVGYSVVKPPPWESECKLLVRYVTEAPRPSPTGTDPNVKPVDDRGDSLINTEIQILNSFDLALKVADRIGVEKILAKAGGGANRDQAAGLIRKYLVVEPRGSVIRIVFKHPDSEMVQPILHEIIETYFRTHLEIHQAGGIVGGFLSREAEQSHAQLAQTEQELRQARNRAGVVSLEDAKRSSSEEMARLRQELFDAQAELAERQAVVEEWSKLGAPSQPAKTNAVSRNTTAAAESYRTVCARLNVLQTRESELLTHYTEEASMVKEVRQRIAQAEAAKKKLEEENPGLVSLRVAAQPGEASAPAIDLAAESARVLALASRIKVLNSQLEQIRVEANSLAIIEPTIEELQRRKEVEENQYRHYSASLQQSRINDALGADISTIQSPVPPYKETSKQRKILLIIVAGGVGLGVGWALLKELLLDQSIKRPKDIDSTLGVPLFLAIPDVSRNGARVAIEEAPRQRLLTNGSGSMTVATANGKAVKPTRAEIARQKRQDQMRPFCEALRDRLIDVFEDGNITRKPKLVGVTGLDARSGVSTIASGLAACLSETDDGNVLLVDMNAGHGAAQHFQMGQPACGLATALEAETRDEAQVGDNLYVVTEGSSSSPCLPPRQFASLVTRLKASDYDYIIFDLPIVNQTSATPRLARSLDFTLLVVESEKTGRHTAKRASELLRRSGANVAAVLNKYVSRAPESLSEG